MKRHRSLLLFVLAWALALSAGAASSADATTTRFASPAVLVGLSAQTDCTDSSAPCSLPAALRAADPGDTISLAAGTYNAGALVLPPEPLHWVATDPQTRPVITSGLAVPTLDLATAQSGTSFDGLEIDNTDHTSPLSTAALQLETGVSAAVRSSVLSARRCVQAPASGPLTIDGSTMSTTANTWCLGLGPLSTVRNSTIGRSTNLLPEIPSPVIRTDGLIEDSEVSGGLSLDANTSVARRVRATGARAIVGEGLVVDSLAQSFGRDQGAIESDSAGGGTLRVVNSTAISTNGPALVARKGEFEEPLVANDLQVMNSIARGKTADILAETDLSDCIPGNFCVVGLIHIDHSDFATRAPLASASDAVAISEGAGNISGDPRFADAANGDYHLLAGSPAIDAGIAADQALPTDLDGSPRVQGAAPDLGAFETPPPPGKPSGSGKGASGAGSAVPTGGGTGAGIAVTGHTPDRTPPVLGSAVVSPTHFRVAGGRRTANAARRHVPLATTVTTTVSEPAPVSFTVQQAEAGRSSGGRCVPSTRALRHVALCTRWLARGPALTRQVSATGKVALAFDGRLGTRRLAPGRYRFAISAVDAAGNRSATVFAPFTVVS